MARERGKRWARPSASVRGLVDGGARHLARVGVMCQVHGSCIFTAVCWKLTGLVLWPGVTPGVRPSVTPDVIVASVRGVGPATNRCARRTALARVAVAVAAAAAAVAAAAAAAAAARRWSSAAVAEDIVCGAVETGCHGQ